MSNASIFVFGVVLIALSMNSLWTFLMALVILATVVIISVRTEDRR